MKISSVHLPRILTYRVSLSSESCDHPPQHDFSRSIVIHDWYWQPATWGVAEAGKFNMYGLEGLNFSWGSVSVLSLVLRTLSVSMYVRVYVSECSFALLAGGHIYHPPKPCFTIWIVACCHFLKLGLTNFLECREQSLDPDNLLFLGGVSAGGRSPKRSTARGLFQ